MKYQIISHQHIFESETLFRQCHASTICLLPDGAQGAAWFGGAHEKAPDVAIWFSRRENGEWSLPVKIADEEGIPCWNPVLFAAEERLFLFYKVGKEISSWQTMVKESRDSGKTWGEARELVPGDFGGRGPVKNKCIILRDGSILAPASLEEGYWRCFADISADGVFIVEYKYIKLQSKMQNVASAFYTKLQASWNELHFSVHGTQVEVTTIKNPL